MKKYLVDFTCESLLYLGILHHQQLANWTAPMIIASKTFFTLIMFYTLHRVISNSISARFFYASLSVQCLFFIQRGGAELPSGSMIEIIWQSYLYLKWVAISITAVIRFIFVKNKSIDFVLDKITSFYLFPRLAETNTRISSDNHSR